MGPKAFLVILVIVRLDSTVNINGNGTHKGVESIRTREEFA
jgi:hypothetical protein